MAVYVDEIRDYESGRWCHMMADSTEELHQFAAGMGLRRSWADHHRGVVDIVHYDLRPNMRALAIQLGAIEITAKAFIARKRGR